MSSEGDEAQGWSKISRMLELLVRLQVHALKGEKTQTEMILQLSSIGFTSAEISSFLVLPKNSVAPILSRAKKDKKPSKPRRKKVSG